MEVLHVHKPSRFPLKVIFHQPQKCKTPLRVPNQYFWEKITVLIVGRGEGAIFRYSVFTVKKIEPTGIEGGQKFMFVAKFVKRISPLVHS